MVVSGFFNYGRKHALFIWLTSIYITRKNVRLASFFVLSFFQTHRTLCYITECIEGPDQAGIYAQIELVIGFSCMYMLEVMNFPTLTIMKLV